MDYKHSYTIPGSCKPEELSKTLAELAKVDKPVRLPLYPASHFAVITTPVRQVRSRYHDAVVDFKTVFDDCLAGASWVEQHHQNIMPEQTMTITVDGKAHRIDNHQAIKPLMKSS